MKRNFAIVVTLLSFLVFPMTGLSSEPVKKAKKKTSTKQSVAKTAEEKSADEAKPGKLTAKSWVKRLRGENKLKAAATGLFPARILFVTEFPAKGDPVFADIDVEEFDKIGFLKAASKKDLEYFFALNQKTKGTQEKVTPVKRTPENWLSILLEASEADSVLVMNKKRDWQLYQNREGKPEILITRPGTKDSAEGVHKWLISALGYEGVVIDKNDKFLLIGNLVNITKKDTQALLLKESANKFSMATAKKEGSGLLQLANHFEGFAMFELLLGDNPETLPVGTKIAIEKSDAKGKKRSKGKQNATGAKSAKPTMAPSTPESSDEKPAAEPEAGDATPTP